MTRSIEVMQHGMIQLLFEVILHASAIIQHLVTKGTFCLTDVVEPWALVTRQLEDDVWGVAVDRAIYLPDFVGPETLVGGCFFTDPAELATF